MTKFLLTLLIIFPSIIFAQSNYHEGYVIKAEGDTVKGFINYKEWDESPTSIQFKYSKTDKNPIEFGPKDTRKFEVTGFETYISYTGLVSMDKTRFPVLPDHFDTTRKVQTVFFKQLTTGKYLTLYFQNDDLKTRFFIAETGKLPVELKYYSYYDENQQVKYLSVYKRQLVYEIGKFYPPDNNLATRVENYKYTESDLTDLIDKINNKTSDRKKKDFARFFVGAGVNSIKTSINNVNFYDHHEDINSVSPQISAGVDIFANPDVQKLIIRGEASFSYINPEYKSTEIQTYPVLLQTDADYTFKQYNVAITPQVLYNIYNTDKLKFYLDGGLSLNVSSYSGSQLTLKKTGDLENSTTITEKPYGLSTIWTSFKLQAGVILNKQLEFSFGYDKGSNYTHSLNQQVGISPLVAQNQSFLFGVRYLFGKH